MPSQVLTSVENNFTKGLVTEFTGLNFPENAAIEADNSEFTLVGDVIRREGIDFEINFGTENLDSSNVANAAKNTYRWSNAGGDGNSQIMVVQTGKFLSFYSITSSTDASPLSNKYISQIDISTYVVSGVTFDPTIEMSFSDGNGYLFVFHKNIDPIFVSFDPIGLTFTATAIGINIRDFQGVQDDLGYTLRPSTLSDEHSYNLQNQGWTSGNAWSITPTVTYTLTAGFTGSKTFTVPSGVAGVTVGQLVQILINGNIIYAIGNVTSYSGTTLVLNLTYVPYTVGSSVIPIVPVSTGYIGTWHTDLGNYPSNSDVWWYFKDNTDAYNPSTTVDNVTLNSGNAPQGHFIISAFNQQRGAAAGLTTITPVTTLKRPSNGAWFQGRAWFSGVSDSQQATGDASYYTWSENIYFSQVCIGTQTNFGNCYQVNDPTSEQLFDLLPTDGGVIQIIGSGLIHKLFPINNGLLVFAANGVWFITGSQGIGFSANDYTITKISSVEVLSQHSFVDVLGLPYFWNTEGIYSVTPSQQGGLTVDTITVGTILSFYNDIPLASKKYARASYHPIDYVIQWIYKSTAETSVHDRYEFDRILNFNTYNKAFFPYSISISDSAAINGINYIQTPESLTAPEPAFKYLTSYKSGGAYDYTFSDEHDTTYTDWVSSATAVDYESYFITGYRLHGQGQRRFQMSYLYTFSRADVPTSYYLQGLWDYATTGNSGRWSTAQLINNWSPNFGVIFRRHKIRGRGLVLQLKISSLSGQPFDLIGWSSFEQQNTGV